MADSSKYVISRGRIKRLDTLISFLISNVNLADYELKIHVKYTTTHKLAKEEGDAKFVPTTVREHVVEVWRKTWLSIRPVAAYVWSEDMEAREYMIPIEIARTSKSI